MKTKGRGLPEVKRQNRVRIKELIYKNAPITRIDIADALGFTLPTVTTSVQNMLREGILQEQPLPGCAEVNPMGGRKPLMLEFRADIAYAIGIELGPYQTTACVVDLNGNIVFQSSNEPAPVGYGAMLSTLVSYVREAIQQVPAEKLLGIGIGLPGFIETSTGLIRSNSRSAWNGKNLASDLSVALNVPVVTDNNARLRAVGEDLFSRERKASSFAYFFVSKGIACPLVLMDNVVAGHTAGAGEIGHTIVKKDGPICPTCGHAGCLESLSGETAIISACESACRNGEAPILKTILQSEHMDRPDIKAIIQAQELGDHAVCEIMNLAVEYLGLSLANVVNLISPGVVLVDGYMMRNEANRHYLMATAAKNFFGLNAEEVRIEFLPFDPFRGAKGAAACVIRQEMLEK